MTDEQTPDYNKMRDDVVEDWINSVHEDPSFLSALLHALIDTMTDEELENTWHDRTEGKE